jgi:Cd2+/Zn2+-exporting ATPase
LDCANCALTLEKGIAQMGGVQSCQVTFATEKMRVGGDVAREDVVARVRELGYDVVEPAPESQAAAIEPLNFFQFMWQRRDTQLALLGTLLIVPGLLFEEILGLHYRLVDLASIGALVAAGLPIARSAWRAVRINREININVLMTIASVGAMLIGAYTEAGMVMVLFAIGEALEGYTASRARDSIRSLMQVAPNEATLLERDDHARERRVEITALRVGDVILVKPGERIPMDGRVIAGASSVNQAPITGESRLVEKVVGSDVFASSVNGEGSLEIEVTHLAADNTISRLIEMVERAQEKRAPTQRFVDRFARYYTPAVVVLAALTAIVPPLFFGQPFLNPDPETFGWLYRGLAMLVVSCPCALVISTPVSIISAISNAARQGVLIKGGAYLETLGRARVIAFDKTGTLTEGKPSVVAVRSAADLQTPANHDETNHVGGLCDDCDDVVALASAVEQRSEHPLAQAVVGEAARRGVQNQYPAAQAVTALTGRGVTGQVAGRHVLVGSHNHFADLPHADVHCAAARQDAMKGYTPMMVSDDGVYVGTIVVTDAVRESSREALDRLRETGVGPLVMLTGDNVQTAQSVGEMVGVTDVRAELLPGQKMAAIEALREQYGTVVMVGDGINDAPALATADVGIAIGAASGGTAQAMETADVALMSDDLRRLPFALRLSRAAMRTIKANVALALGIKLGFLVLVLVGLGTMWMAVLADMGTSLLVTLNGMRLLRWSE